MKIRITDIPEEGLEINSDSTRDGWLKNILTDVLNAVNFQKADGGRLNLKFFRNDKNVTIVGGVVLQFHPKCDRCLVQFKKQEQIAVHQVMIPHMESKFRGKEEVDDEDITFYKGGEINIEDIIRETVVLDQQMVNLCKDDCKGLCGACGVNLNEKSCGCEKKRQKEKESPFAAIKKFKLKKLKKT